MKELPIEDEFRGDDEHLRRSIEALIRMNDDGVLVPHGIGGHARTLLASSWHRLVPREPYGKTIGELSNKLSQRDAALRWLAYGNTGTSSKCMLMCHLGLTGDYPTYDPGDCNDLERCILLVQAVPAVRESFPRIAAMSPVWAAVVEHWDRLEALYLEHGNRGRWVDTVWVYNAYVIAAQAVILGAR